MRALAASLMALLWLSLPCRASEFDQAIADYKAHRYSQAIAAFQTISSKYPGDAKSHYYMGLCYQGLNQMTLAKQHYQWVVAYSKDASLKSYSQSALAQLGRYPTSVAGSPTVSSSSSSAGRSGSVPALGNLLAGMPGVAGAAPKISGRLKVIDFSTSWCKGCKSFEPEFHAVASKYGGQADFETLDGDNPSVAGMKSEYGVTGYPTVVFCDSNKHLETIPAPTRSALEGKIRYFLGK